MSLNSSLHRVKTYRHIIKHHPDYHHILANFIHIIEIIIIL